MKTFILRLVLTVALLWRVWLGDRWALVLTLALLTLGIEMAVYQLQKIRRSQDFGVKGRIW